MSTVRTTATSPCSNPVPTAVQRPGTVTEAAQLLRDTTGPVLFRGGGTKPDWAGRVRDPHLVLSTERLDGLLTHNAADMTASVRAGTPLTTLQDLLAGHGQWLALDPPSAASGATLGGLLAAGDSGPSRLRYGNLRDLVIGVTLVLADGTVARSGGHVIKNVAGYDLAKLVHGSLGSLALVAEVVLRLHPRPASSITIVGAADAAQATTAALRIAASTVEPTAVEWAQEGGSGRLAVRCDGTPRAVAAATQEVTTLLADVGVAAEACPPAETPALWAAHAALVTGQEGETVVRVATLPSDLGSTAQHLVHEAAAAGVQAHLVSSAALGLHTARLHGGRAHARAQVVAAVRRHALERGGSVMLRRRPADVDAVVDPLGPSPSAVAVLRRVKAEFDPTGRCAPGRFHPWY